MTDLVRFLIGVATLLATPGPTNTLLALAGATQTLRRALALLLAELGGYATSIAILRLLVVPLIGQVPAVGIALKIAAALYVIYLAIKLWRAAPKVVNGQQSVGFGTVYTTTLLNPKGLIFALTLLPAEHPQLPLMFLVLAACIPLIGGCWIVAGRLLGASAGAGRDGIFKRIASVALLAFAGLIAASALG